MRVLHILRDIEDPRAVATMEEQRQQGHEVAVLLLHDAVLSPSRFEGEVYACKSDLIARRAEGRYPSVDYDEIIQMIFDYDKVIAW